MNGWTPVNIWYPVTPRAKRSELWLILLLVIGAAAFVALQTAAGRTVWQFATDSRTEVRKVVWPTRQETLQTLLIITIAVLLTALFLWAIDSLLFMIVRYLTGQGG